MKVLLITDTYNEKGGGAEKVFFTLKKNLEKRKLQVYSLGFSNYSKESSKVKIIKSSDSVIIRHIWRLFFNLNKYRQIRDYIKKVNPNVIHIHNINKYTISLLKALKGYKVIYSVHDYGLVCPTMWNVHNDLSPCQTGLKSSCLWKHKRDTNIFVYLSLLFFFYRRNKLVSKIVSHYFTSTPILKGFLEKQGFSPVTVIPDPTLSKIVPKPEFNKIKKNHFLFASHLVPNKGVTIALEEFILATKKKKNLYLTIAGEGPLKEDLVQKIKEEDLDKQISFVGWVNLKEYYKKYCALIAPSIWTDNNPIIVQEMLFYARPVIGSNRGGMLYTIEDKKSGFIINPLNKGELAKRIIELCDVKKVKQMGASAQKRIQKINKLDYNDYVKVYKNVTR